MNLIRVWILKRAAAFPLSLVFFAKQAKLALSHPVLSTTQRFKCELEGVWRFTAPGNLRYHVRTLRLLKDLLPVLAKD